MRINLRLDWRALALLGALLSFIIAWPGLVFAMPALTMSNNNNTIFNLTNITKNIYVSNNNNNNNTNNLTLTNIKSDHSHSSVLPAESFSFKQNQSISAEFNVRTLAQPQQKQQQEQQQQQPQQQSQQIEEQRSALTTTKQLAKRDSKNSTESREIDEEFEEKLMGFVFSVASREHLAILSRTERSIRHQQQQQQHHHNHHQHQHQQQQEQEQLATAANIDNNFIGSKTKRLNNSRSNLHINSSSNNHHHNNNNNHNNLDRNERSTVTHLTTSRKIQLYMKNRFLQILPDGTVVGTQQETEYTIMQREALDTGRIKIQSVATCLFLCLDACGSVYGSKVFKDEDCVFNENMGQQHYNYYTSTYNSNARRVLYLALNRFGEPRKLQIPPTKSLGKLAVYANTITETVSQERVEQLITKNFGANRIDHGVRQLCDTGMPLIELTARNFKAPPQCNPNTSNSSKSTNSNSNSSSSSSNSNSNTNSNPISSSSNSSGQTLNNNVPAANDRARRLNSISNIGNSNLLSSSSGSGSSLLLLHSNSSQSESGHISNSSNNNNNTSNSNSNSPTQKPKKKRKCKLGETEQEHNCRRLAGALRIGPKRCRKLKEQAKADGLPPPNCQLGGKRGGPKRKANRKHPNEEASFKKKGAGGVGRAAGKQQQRPNAGGSKRKGRNGAAGAGAGAGGVKRKNLRQNPLFSTTTISSSLATPEASSLESSSPLPALSLSGTSDRVERFARNPAEPERDDSADAEENEEDVSLQSSEDDDVYDEAPPAAAAAAAASSGADDVHYYDQLDV
ncbi:putative uncharacterized protein DDB_G0282129 [Scaptodrosophila lebanonensis]|uniref:Fibroblast growth factor n=1 Tax=Drosophila lebanonensis TaxID=7225 RepID=A0A6J2TC62_DROLE|nr:putative uncharacterized protein DDB_G0282129 [Scaptodrosophila lebanonensis]